MDEEIWKKLIMGYKPLTPAFDHPSPTSGRGDICPTSTPPRHAWRGGRGVRRKETWQVSKTCQVLLPKPTA